MDNIEKQTSNSQNDSNIHSGHRERLKDRIEAVGVDRIPPHEVLEYILFYCIPRKDTNPLAHALIDTFGSLSGVFEADIKDLEKVNGISHSTALFLHSIPGITRYYFKDRWDGRPTIKDSVTLGQYLCDLFAGEKNEAFYVLSFDSKCRLINSDLVYRGTINETPIYPRLVIEYALKNNAAAVVLAHNHPGGNLSASESDMGITKTLVDLLTPLCIKVMDHVIVCGSRFSSLKTKGLFNPSIQYSAREYINENLNGDWHFD